MIKKVLFTLSTLILVSSVQAETMRTRLTKENRFPELYHPEVGTIYTFEDYSDDSEVSSFDTYLRLGLAEGFALIANVPYVDTEDGLTGDEESGLGDIRVGFEWLMWEDIFRYPWVVSHVELDTDTGDEDDGLGDGESSIRIGVTVGTVTHDNIHWAAEARYQFNDEIDDIASGAISIGYAVSDQFMVLAEAEIRDEEDDGETDSPFLMIGGFFYQINDLVSLSTHIGAENSSDKDTFVSSKIAVCF